MLAEQIGPVFIVTITEASWSILRSCRWSRSSGRSSLSSWSRSPVGQSGRDHQGLVFCAERVRLAATVVDDAEDSRSARESPMLDPMFTQLVVNGSVAVVLVVSPQRVWKGDLTAGATKG
jgi:hypothetical protein